MADTEKNNDSLENFFKHHLQDYDIKYNEQDWLDVEKRLDLADAKKAYNQRMRWMVAASVLFLTLLGYFTFENYTAINRLSEQIVGEETPQKIEQDAGDQELPDLITQDRSDEQEEPRDLVDNNSSKQGNNNEKVEEHTAAKLAESEAHETQKNFDIAVSEQATEALYISELSCPACMDISSEAEGVPIAFSGSISSSPDVQNMIAEAAVSNIYSVENENIDRKKSPLINAGFVLGPDLSTAGSISNFRSPGYKIGFTIEVNLSSRLAISSGIIHSKVRYEALGREYRPPPGYWSNGIIAQKTLAECALLDIPISMKYDFLQFDRSRLYATTGLSSYIMLSEDYQFRYANDAPGQAKSWSKNTGTSYWLSNASFSLGYELDVLPNWSLQVEPFVKLPLKGVGLGNVKLYSVGSFISWNYKFRNVR